jgi:hypothetical protein
VETILSHKHHNLSLINPNFYNTLGAEIINQAMAGFNIFEYVNGSTECVSEIETFIEDWVDVIYSA